MSDIDDLLPDDRSSAEKRRAPRESVFLSAVVTAFGSGITKHRVRNISASGVCIDQADGLKLGQTVAVALGILGDVGATVMWIDNGLAGLRFAQAIELTAAKTRPKPAHVEQGWGAEPWRRAVPPPPRR